MASRINHLEALEPNLVKISVPSEKPKDEKALQIANVEIDEEKTPKGFNEQIGDSKKEREVRAEGITPRYALASIQRIQEEESCLEKNKGETTFGNAIDDEFVLDGNCLNSFFFPSFEIKENDEQERNGEKVKDMGSCEKIEKASPPKASKKKKESNDKDALGYGNVEEALALDGVCLQSLFSTTREREKDCTKGEGTKTKKKKPIDTHPPALDKSSHTMKLIPRRHDDGAIGYKVQCKGRSKPFASVRAILTPEFKEKGHTSLQEVMSKVLHLELKDPPWSDHTPPSPA